MSIFKGIAGKRAGEPVGVCFHNDAGSASANAGFYEGWLPNHNPESGFAHAYVAEDGILMAEDLTNKAWHCGNGYGNDNFLSVEICQSMGDEAIFRENERKALDLVADWFCLYGWTPDKNTVRIHKQFASTSCPHRSCEIHGDAQEYFINELKKRLSRSINVKEVRKMNCLFRVEGDAKTYWFNGQEVRYLSHPDQIVILNRIYKDCYGKEMPCYVFKSSAPYHLRLIQACHGAVQKA